MKENHLMRTSRRTLATTGLLLAVGVVAAGCGSDAAAGDDAAPAGGDGEVRSVYALLPQGTDQPYGTTYLPPMEEEAEARNIELTITNSQYDADRQASDCQVAVAAEPDLIILWPAVGDTVRPCLSAADAAGIPVTVTNSDVNPEDKDLTAGYSGPDTYGQGVSSAEIMCELADGEEVGILVVNGLTGNSTAINRRDGFIDTIAEQCPNVTVLAEQPGDWNKDTSQTVTSEMLTAVGAENVGGIYAADDTMVAGAIDALKARDIDPEPLHITSIGNTKLGNPLVVSGELDGTVFQSSSWDGRNAVVVADQVLSGEELTEDLFMPSVKVTAENAEDPEVAPEW
jgi:ribose transport system substrate-binding protein